MTEHKPGPYFRKSINFLKMFRPTFSIRNDEGMD
jgi:hypothetical protein